MIPYHEVGSLAAVGKTLAAVTSSKQTQSTEVLLTVQNEIIYTKFIFLLLSYPSELRCLSSAAVLWPGSYLSHTQLTL